MEDLEYRKGVYALIVDNENKFLLLNLVSYNFGEYTFCGGGLEENETYEQALYREINEELGLDAQDFEMVGQFPEAYQYDFPAEEVAENMEKTKLGIATRKLYRGQRKEVFMLRFLGDKEKIKLQDEEINSIEWVNESDLANYLLFPNQYETTRKFIEYFSNKK